MTSPTPPSEGDALVRRHLRFGWSVILASVSLGLVLDALHGFKVDWYLNVANETRRLVWTLAHAHGVLLGLLNVVFAATLAAAPGWVPAGARRLASPCLVAATLLLPAGFFLGGVVVYGGDPNPAILLTPLGGALLFAAVFAIARGTFSRGS